MGEGVTYSVQCTDCLLRSKRSLYQRETFRSTRERHLDDARDLEQGLTYPTC